MNFTGPVQISGSATGDFGTVQLHPLGTQAITRDGRKYRYVFSGAVALVEGNVIQGPAVLVNHLALTPSAAAIGATQVVATLGATAAAVNEYAGGWVQVDTTPGNGQTFAIAGHAAVLSAGVITANLDPSDPVRVALTAASRVGLVHSPYGGGSGSSVGVIQTPITTATGKVVGVACSAIPINQFGWVQSHGLAACLINGTPALGATVIGVSAGAAGAADIATAVTILTGQIIGKIAQIGVSGKNNGVYLELD